MFTKNTAVTGFTVGLISSTDGSPVTTGTPVGYYTIDGGSQTPLADTSPVHEGLGQWSFSLTAAEMNGDIIGLTFTHSSAITVYHTIKTETLVSDIWNKPVSELTAIGSIGKFLSDFDYSTLDVDAALAVRAELATELARLDAAISSRLASGTTVSANVTQVNGYTVSGSGQVGNEWGPA
jgi:hypothetical protein